MPLSVSAILFLTVAVFCCSVITGMLGMAGGVMFLGILASYIETSYVVPIYAVVMMISSGSRTALFYDHINWQIFLRYTLGLLPGALLGIYIFQLLPKDLIKLGMGIFILITIFLPVSKRESSLDRVIFIPVGFIAGLIGIFFGASGPFTSSFYLRQGIIKEALIATKSATTLLEQSLKIFLFGLIGINVLSYGPLLICLGLAVFPGIYVGKLLLNKVSEQLFIRAFRIILFILAMRIIITQVYEMAGA